MTPRELQERTKLFAIQIVQFVDGLPRSISVREIGRQLVRSGTCVGANYRAACLGRSKREFVSKLQIVYEEADESVYWLDVLNGSGYSLGQEHEALRQEGLELTKIFAASLKTSRSSL